MSTQLYSIQSLKELSDNNEVFIREMIELFVKETRPLLINIETGIAAKEAASVNKLVHSIKSNMNPYGITGAAEKLLYIEKETLAQVRWELVQQTFEEVKTQILAAIFQMEKDYNIS